MVRQAHHEVDKLLLTDEETFLALDIPQESRRRKYALERLCWARIGSKAQLNKVLTHYANEEELLTDEEIIGDFCDTCDYSLEGCLEHGQQATCASYKEALRQKKEAAKAQIAKSNLRAEAKLGDKKLQEKVKACMATWRYALPADQTDIIIALFRSALIREAKK